MNKSKRDNRYNSVDGVSSPGRRSLRSKRPLQNRRTESNQKQRSINDFQRARIGQSRRNQPTATNEASQTSTADGPIQNPPTNQPRRPKSKRRFKFLSYLWPSRSGLKKIGMVFGVALLAVGGFFGWKLWNAANAVIVERGDQAIGLNREIRPEDLTEEGSARINILLIGIPGEANYDGRLLNDVTMVLSVDPASEDASMLSIPRDLVVDLEDYGLNKINAAHSYGEDNSDTTGPALLEQTVEEVLDININYFARVDFQGFIDTVDVLGGVTVDNETALYDPTIEKSFGVGGGGYYLPAGTHKLNGAQALQFVRCRKGTCGSDFGRAERQQQILQDIRGKVLSVGTFANPGRISNLLDQLSQHFRTDISIGEGLQLYELTRNYGSPRSYVLNTEPDNYLGASSFFSGGLAPTAGHLNFAEIHQFVRGDLFRDGFLKRENAPITILNGTTIAAQASSLETRLNGLGYNVVEADNAPEQNQPDTVVYQRKGSESEFTKHLLGMRMNVTIKDGIPDKYKQFKGDYIIVIGADYDAV